MVFFVISKKHSAKRPTVEEEEGEEGRFGFFSKHNVLRKSYLQYLAKECKIKFLQVTIFLILQLGRICI